MLQAIPWAKVHMSHLESRRLEPGEDSLQPRRRKVDGSAHLDRQKACRSNFRTVTRFHSFVTTCPAGLQSRRQNPTLARGMTNNPIEAITGEIIRFVSKSERDRIRLIRESRARYDSVFLPADPVSEQRDKGPQLMGPSGGEAFS
jgi:hypothetical protein